MAEFSIPKPGEICWRELATKDLAKAMDFYSQLFGWNSQQTKSTPMDYKEIIIDGMAIRRHDGDRRSWGENPPAVTLENLYRCRERGRNGRKDQGERRSIQVPPFDAPGVGRMSIAPIRRGAVCDNSICRGFLIGE